MSVLFSRFTGPKIAFFFERFLFFVDPSKNKSSYFCASQQKKRTARKELVKRTGLSGHVNRLIV